MDWTDDYIHGGEGSPVILVHGWPFNKESFRKITPALGKKFSWYAYNAIGMNRAGFDHDTDFCLTAHAARLIEFADARKLTQFHVVGHDTGASIARLAAAIAPDRVQNLVLLNTEIPGHRPPFIRLYQQITRMPGSQLLFSFFLRQGWFNRSAMGYGGSFYEMTNMDAEFLSLFVDGWVTDKAQYRGYTRYLQGIDWNVVDNLRETHKALACPVHFIWGKNDRTFPVREAREMAAQMPTCKSFVEIDEACFALHEERPEQVSAAILTALSGD